MHEHLKYKYPKVVRLRLSTRYSTQRIDTHKKKQLNAHTTHEC